MKYIEKYLEEKLKIKPLGEMISTRNASNIEIIIDGIQTGIIIPYQDYIEWLESQIDYKTSDYARLEDNSITKICTFYNEVLSENNDRRQLKGAPWADFVNEVTSRFHKFLENYEK